MAIRRDDGAALVVSGASGRVGRTLLRDLSLEGSTVRALTRAPEGQTALPGVEWVYADLLNPSTLAKALVGAGRFFLLTSNDLRMVEAQKNAITAAVDAGVGYMVKQSALGASDHSRSPIARGHYEIERSLMGSRLSWTILRPHYFMDNLLSEAGTLRTTGELRSPLGAARIPFIDAADIGHVAARLLAGSGYRGEKLVLTGGAALDYGAVATTMSEVLGRTIRYREESLKEARGRLVARGAPPWEVESVVALWEYQRAGGATAMVSTDVRRVLGRDPRSVREFLTEHRAEFGFRP